jgi:hypothetical protein
MSKTTTTEVLPRVAVIITSLVLVTAPAVAMKVADVDPAGTVTATGVLIGEFFSNKETEVPPAGAAVVKLIVQVVLAPGGRVVGLQFSADRSTIAKFGVTGARRFTVAVLETPPSVAVTVTAWLVVMLPAVTGKVADVVPDVTVSEAGVVSPVLLSESETEEPAAGAAELSVAVQVAVAPEDRLVGLQASEEMPTGAVRFSVALRETPFSVAVTEAVWVLAITPAVALKVPVVVPAATVTEAGVVSNVLPLDTETAVPPAGAGLVRVTVQLLVAPEARLEGLQPSVDKPRVRTVIVLPVPVMAMPVPVGSEPIVFVRPTLVVPAAGAIVVLTVAITPLAITVEFMPVATHM